MPKDREKQVSGEELVAKLNSLLTTVYKREMNSSAVSGKPLAIQFIDIDKKDPKLAETLLRDPALFFDMAEKALESIDLPAPVKVKVKDVELTNIRDLRSRHINKFICIEGIVRRASEIRPEIVETTWECPDCGELVRQPAIGSMIFKPFQCSKCGNKNGLKQLSKKMIDTRWVVVEEPFELTEGDRPSQITVQLTDDLLTPDGRRMSDPGNRLRITGVLKEMPRGKFYSVKLDFYMEANHVDPTESGWMHMDIKPEEEEEIKKMAADPMIYERLTDSLAPSLYGLREIKESIILQLFGGVPRTLKDNTHFRGDIHILLVGDPASGKSQLLKLVPEIVPRGRYVSGKGVTGAGLCMSYDTLVPSAHGEIRKIGDIVEEALKNGSQRINDGMNDGYVGTRGDFEIVCLDSKTLKMKKTRVSKFFKLKPRGSLVTLRMRTGREIKLTQENPVLVVKNGELAWKQTSDLLPGEHIALARYLPVNHLPVNEEPEFARFLGMVAGDGDIGAREIRFHNGSERYLDGFSGICRNLGYNPRKYYQKNRVACVRVASKSLCDKVESLGMPRGRKADKISIPREILLSNKLVVEFLSGIFDCDGCVVSKGNGSYVEYTTTSKMLAQQMQTCLLRFGIMTKVRQRTPSMKGFKGKLIKYEIIARGRENLKAFRKHIGFTCEKAEKLDRVLSREIKPNTNIDLIPGIGAKLGEVRKSLGIRTKNDKELYLIRHYEHGRRDFSRDQLLKFAGLLRQRKECEYFRFLERLAQSDIFWDEIVSKKDAQEEWVYDLTVDGEHNFIANDFVVHNTATVTKDEQFMGGWVLEAGALVLTNKGLLSIDEFEKMSPEDQVAMHEALEQGTISIAKASIVATLPAYTSVLAGGNPKFSRFDPYMPIVKQITIPDTLLTRFDLKFVLRDVPDSEQDKKIVDHVLRTREDGFKESEPAISNKLIKKYVAYAKEHTKPVLGPETGKMLRKFYIQTRKKAEGTGGGPVPITLRQFEALIRLSEASAKIQLRDEINKEDAQRAIRLMRASLIQLGLEPETGMIDIDRAEGAATSSTERSKIRIVMDIINELSQKTKEIPVSELQKAAKKEGLEDIDEVIEKLKREGMLFEPNPGYVQKV
jgi:replicative DNA helicase Mcm